MKISRLFLLLLIAGLFLIPAVSAEILEEFSSNAEMYDYTSKGSTTWPGTSLYIYRIENYHGLEFVYAKIPAAGISSTYLNSIKATPYYERPVTLKIGTATIGTGIAYYNGMFSSSGSVTDLQMWIEIDTFDPGTRTGAQIVTITPSSGALFNGYYYYQSNIGPSVDNPIGFMTTTSGVNKYYTSSVMVRTDFYWTSILNYDDQIIELTRNVDGVPYASTLAVSTTLDNYTDYSANDITVPYSGVASWTVTTPTGKMFSGQIGEESADNADSTLTVYIQNSQTGALISGAQAVVSAGFYDPAELIEVSNTTLSGGTKTYTLQPTGGGLPNPDYYRVSVTADGYNAEMPYADITLDAGMSMTMVMGMEPTYGPPADPGDTYIDVYVRDIYANPIADATVKMGAYTLKTNSAGYTMFDVPVNSTYTYTVKKTGYTSVEGSVTVADAARYPVNIVMGTGVIPTNTPTPQPTVPGDTPTVPTGEETPGPGFIDQSANNFATFLGVSYTVGRAALGMLIATAIGFTTARKLKGGAPEFGIGFIAGAALMVLITLLPAWIFIVMVIIVGGLLGYKYMNGGS